MSRLESDFYKCSGPENGGGDDGGNARGNKDQDTRAERLYQDLVNARTNHDFQAG
jgi:hypothetical protein